MNFNRFMALVIKAETESRKCWADYDGTEGLPPLPKNWGKPKQPRSVVSVPLGAKKA
jgi:hypothetical protein